MKDVMEYEDNTVWLDRTIVEIRDKKGNVIDFSPGYSGLVHHAHLNEFGDKRHFYLEFSAVDKDRPFLHDPRNLFILCIKGFAFDHGEEFVKVWGNAQYLAGVISKHVQRAITLFER